jgi:hypothetical protein
MGELIGPRRGLAQQRRRARLVEGVEHCVLAQLRDNDQHVEIDHRADDRCQRQHRVGGLAQTAQTATDDLAHPLGDGELRNLGVCRPSAVALGQTSGLDQAAEDLLHEEGVAVGL